MKPVLTRRFALTFGMLGALAGAAWAQHGGAGIGLGRSVGNATGSVTGTVGDTVHGTVSQPNAPVASGKPGPAGVGSTADAALRVTDNAELSTRLQPLLPAGASLAAAEAGFGNQGQFIAALHAAHNLNIPFDQLKARITGASAESLGKAIHDLRPSLNNGDVKNNVKLAEQQTDRDIRQAASAGKPDNFAARIASNTQLATRLQTLLPPGMTLEMAAAGFKNQGQFIATLEASKNLGIPFTDLKDRITAGQSLGEAIHQLKPALSTKDVNASVKDAEEQSRNVEVEASANANTGVSASATR
ncbi:MAG TPA: hypothetical protein VGR73_21955 [Bryobacteraceae bacterium]|nr:hypothetical protein [Bryobacteraceae bacterium]